MRIFDKNHQPPVSFKRERHLKNDALMTLKRGYDVTQSRREMSLVSDNMAEQNR